MMYQLEDTPQEYYMKSADIASRSYYTQQPNFYCSYVLELCELSPVPAQHSHHI